MTVELLAQRGLRVRSEIARAYVDEEILKGRTIQEIRSDMRRFQCEILRRALASEAALPRDELRKAGSKRAILLASNSSAQDGHQEETFVEDTFVEVRPTIGTSERLLESHGFHSRGLVACVIPKEQVGSQNGRDRVDRSLECGLLLVEARRKRQFEARRLCDERRPICSSTTRPGANGSAVRLFEQARY